MGPIFSVSGSWRFGKVFQHSIGMTCWNASCSVRAACGRLIILMATLGFLGPASTEAQQSQLSIRDILRSDLTQQASVRIATDKTLNLTPDAKVDEQLYLIRKLEVLHSRCPTELEDSEKVSRELAALRHELVRALEFAKAKGMDDRLVTMYSDSIEMVDRYGELLSDLGALDKEFYRKSIQQSIEAGVAGFKEGSALGSALAAAGIEPTTATFAIAGMTIKKAVEEYQQQKQLEEEKNRALERRLSQYLNERSRLLARIQIQAGALAEKFGWGAHEVGFDEDEKESQQILAAVESGRYDLLLERAKTLKKLRPRDPFVYAASGELWALMARSTIRDDMDDVGASLRAAAVKDYLRAVELIPAGKFHDDLRVQYLWKAAFNGSLMLYHSRQKNELPITLANTALALRPLDPDGWIRYVRAYALARNGYHDEAIALFETVGAVQGRDKRFHYELARLLSMAGRVDEAMLHLKTAWDMGERRVRWLKKDKELARLRIRKAVDFAELIQLHWEWRIDYGFFWNDFVVENKGSYSLRNVAIKATWKDTSGATYSEVYWTDAIPAGGTVKFQGVFDNASKRKADNEGCKASILADEIRSPHPPKGKDVIGRYTGVATVMRSDGSDVKTSSEATLDVEDAGAGKLRLNFSGGGAVIEVVANDLWDGSTGADVEMGSIQRIRVFFDETTVYGWCQNSTDAANGYIRAFWLEKCE